MCCRSYAVKSAGDFILWRRHGEKFTDVSVRLITINMSHEKAIFFQCTQTHQFIMVMYVVTALWNVVNTRAHPVEAPLAMWHGSVGCHSEDSLRVTCSAFDPLLRETRAMGKSTFALRSRDLCCYSTDRGVKHQCSDGRSSRINAAGQKTGRTVVFPVMIVITVRYYLTLHPQSLYSCKVIKVSYHEMLGWRK